MQLSRIDRRLLVLYALINLPVFLFLNGVFWDDWVLFNTSKDVILERFEQVGSPFNFAGHFHSFMMLGLGAWSYRILVFIAFAANIVLGNLILRNLGFSENIRFFFALAMVVMPFFGSRFAAINSIYILCTTCFLGAWLAHQAGKHFAAPFLYCAAFLTQSYLVFFSIPYLIAYVPTILKLDFNRRKLVEIALYTSLPFVFFFVKTLFFPATGAYEGYLTLDPSLVFLSFMRIAEVSAVTLMYSTAQLGYWDVFALAGITAVFFVLINTLILKPGLTEGVHVHKKFEKVSGSGLSSQIVLFLMVIAACFLAIFPYLIVGNPPNFYYGYESRNQTVLILPACLAIAFIFLKFWSFFRPLPGLLLAIGATAQIVIYFAYGDDWRKQEAIVEGLENIRQQVVERNIFVVQDQTEIRNVEMRKYSWYELSGIFRYGLDREAVFVRDEQYWGNDVCHASLQGSPLYNTGGFGDRSNNVVVRVTLRTENEIKVPVIGHMGYSLDMEVTEHDWCTSVCGSCGF